MSAEDTQYDLSDLLGQIIAFDARDRAIWPASQLRQMLRRQLTERFPAGWLPDGSEAAAEEPPLRTFEDLLLHPAPPLDLLCQTKEFAKRARGDRRGFMAPEVALLLYYGCIAAALLRHGRRISTLGEDELRQGLNWACQQPWLEERLRRLFAQTLAFIRAGRDRWRS